jgi:hypothetical protein
VFSVGKPPFRCYNKNWLNRLESGLARSMTLIFEIPTLQSRRLSLRAIGEDDLSHLLTMSRDFDSRSCHNLPPIWSAVR